MVDSEEELHNKHNQLDTPFTLTIKVQSLDMFQALLSHLQETLHKHAQWNLTVSQ
jgi:hypothetical protein